ncbi:uncharacterized protein [Eleutherodactylus coqui]|uniref:uncharacterized protein n=1 Tax=Eleutherodactylus coqui TaxID=57060 RepID=UPI003461E480
MKLQECAAQKSYPDNHILKCQHLFHQYIVDMYAKIDTERLLFIRLNQTKLHSEEYIHLRDAIATDGNPNELGKMVILPATFTGSPRHMHEYAQDAMTYVRAYGRPDFFITFTCNPTWDEIKELLLPRQLPSDRHDIIARVFKQKLKSMMDFIVKHYVFGETRCWMYSIEWQKRGLPHAHILIWLIDKITPDKIDEVISAEIPDFNIDPGLFEVVTKNMLHGPCGTINNYSPCMKDGKCTKRYPRDLHAETITRNDGYPQYRRRSTEDGGKLITLKVHNNDIEVDNRWVVPYSPLLSKMFKAHINVEYCNSVKSIKYICKYVNKGSDMAVFGVENASAPIDEIERYQLGRYISSNEAVWRIFSFPIHERHPTVVHLAVHLENGERVYFTTENNLPKLVPEQCIVYDTIMKAITNQSRGLYFIDAPGGTGKTFLISIILATIRSRNKIALAIASSGIAATLLDGGRTVHSALKLPLNLQATEMPTCNITKNSGMDKVLQTCELIIWDECTMAHKKALEALDRTLQDLRGNAQPFGGALILLSGDFRQTLPVIPRSTPADELNACLKSSVLWRHVKKLTLKTNMRVQLQNDASAERFAKQLLDIGNGKMPIDRSTQCITLPTNFGKMTSTKDELIQKVFPNIARNYKNHQWLSARAILAATNNDVSVNAKTVTNQ